MTGIPACSRTFSTFTRRANFTSWRSCVSSPSGLPPSRVAPSSCLTQGVALLHCQWFDLDLTLLPTQSGDRVLGHQRVLPGQLLQLPLPRPQAGEQPPPQLGRRERRQQHRHIRGRDIRLKQVKRHCSQLVKGDRSPRSPTHIPPPRPPPSSETCSISRRCVMGTSGSVCG